MPKANANFNATDDKFYDAFDAAVALYLHFPRYRFTWLINFMVLIEYFLYALHATAHFIDVVKYLL